MTAYEPRDQLDFLDDLDVTLAWAGGMAYRVLWLAEERVFVLNAQEPRWRLAEDVRSFLADELTP